MYQRGIFKRRWDFAIFSVDLTLEGSILQRIGAATEKPD